MRHELQQILETVMNKHKNREFDPTIFVFKLRQKGWYGVDEQETILNYNILAQRRIKFIDITKHKEDGCLTEFIKELHLARNDAAKCFEEELRNANLSIYFPEPPAPSELDHASLPPRERERIENELYFSLRKVVDSAPWDQGHNRGNKQWGMVDIGASNVSFIFKNRRINAVEEKNIRTNFAKLRLTDELTEQYAEGTASYSPDGMSSFELRRTSACRSFIKLGLQNGWW